MIDPFRPALAAEALAVPEAPAVPTDIRLVSELAASDLEDALTDAPASIGTTARSVPASAGGGGFPFVMALPVGAAIPALALGPRYNDGSVTPANIPGGPTESPWNIPGGPTESPSGREAPEAVPEPLTPFCWSQVSAPS